jgi:hypothetical protein
MYQYGTMVLHLFSDKKIIYLNVHFLAPVVIISRLDPYLHPDPQRCILSIRNWYPSLRNKPDPPTTFLDIPLPVFIRFYLYIFSLSPSLRVTYESLGSGSVFHQQAKYNYR